MYTQLRESLSGASASLRWPVRVSPVVLYLGLTSLFTDVSSEMVSTVLPVYLVLYLQFSPLQFGILDGLYQGVSALVRMAGGLAADRWGRHKEVAAGGYALSAICKLGLLAAGGAWTALAGVVVADRIGKGIRTAPRDALISLNSDPRDLGAAFGVHRALDTLGALLGPLLAFALLALVPGAFDVVFVVSFCVALVGLGVLVLFVEGRDPRPAGHAGNATGQLLLDSEPPPFARSADMERPTSLDREPRPDVTAARPIGPQSREEPSRPAPSFGRAVRLIGAPRYRTLVLAGTVLGLATIGDGFLYLGLQRRLRFGGELLPLLYVGTSVAYFALSVPVGRLADRVGRARIFLGGYALLPLVYLTLLLPSPGLAMLFVCLALFGAYYAATDGVLMALASSMLPAELRGSGLAMLATGVSLARLVGAVLFGALWTWWSLEAAVLAFGATLLGTLAIFAMVFARQHPGMSREPTAPA